MEVTGKMYNYLTISNIMSRKADLLHRAAAEAPTDALMDTYASQAAMMDEACLKTYFLWQIGENATNNPTTQEIHQAEARGVRRYAAQVAEANKTANWLERAGFKFQEAFEKAVRHAF